MLQHQQRAGGTAAPVTPAAAAATASTHHWHAASAATSTSAAEQETFAHSRLATGKYCSQLVLQPCTACSELCSAVDHGSIATLVGCNTDADHDARLLQPQLLDQVMHRQSFYL